MLKGVWRETETVGSFDIAVEPHPVLPEVEEIIKTAAAYQPKAKEVLTLEKGRTFRFKLAIDIEESCCMLG